VANPGRQWFIPGIADLQLRLATIIFTTLGGLVPLLHGADVQLPFMDKPGYGYIYLALAAACLGLDRFFGLSSAWMRDLRTSMAMQRDLAEFQMDWAMAWPALRDGDPNDATQRELLTLLKRFHLRIADRVARETETWISEFQVNLAQLERNAKADLEPQRTGGIAL